jgi:hypothetical protein
MFHKIKFLDDVVSGGQVDGTKGDDVGAVLLPDDGQLFANGILKCGRQHLLPIRLKMHH